MHITAPTEIGNLEPGREALLKEFGITQETYGRASLVSCRSSGHRAVHISSIKSIVSELLEENPGVTLFCAETVLKKLRSVGAGKTVQGSPIRCANAIGDALGKHGLGLPSVVKEGKKRFLLSAVEHSEEEKAIRQQMLDELSAKELRAMPVA